MKQFKTESKRILDLMINSIYTNKEIFLRELISNASDAIDKLRFLSLTDGNVKTDFEIRVTADKEKKQLAVEDNGIGMSEADMEKNLGVIAESGTLAFKKETRTKRNLSGSSAWGFIRRSWLRRPSKYIPKSTAEKRRSSGRLRGRTAIPWSPAIKRASARRSFSR